MCASGRKCAWTGKGRASGRGEGGRQGLPAAAAAGAGTLNPPRPLSRPPSGSTLALISVLRGHSAEVTSVLPNPRNSLQARGRGARASIPWLGPRALSRRLALGVRARAPERTLLLLLLSFRADEFVKLVF